MSEQSQMALVEALEACSYDLSQRGVSIIGASISAAGAPGSSGTVIGAVMSNVTISVSASSGANAEAGALMKELHDAIEAAKAGKANKGWMESITGRLGRFADAAVIAGMQLAIRNSF